MKLSRNPVSTNQPTDPRRPSILLSSDLEDARKVAKRLRNYYQVNRLSNDCYEDIHDAVSRHHRRKKYRPQKMVLKAGRFLRLYEEKIRAQVEPIVRGLYRGSRSSWAGGETKIYVTMSATPNAVGRSSYVVSRNGKWTGTNAELEVNVSPDWIRNIATVKGLERVDYMLTTHAEQIEPLVWEAAWVKQSRGFALQVQEGYIFQAPTGYFFHAKTVTAGKKRLKRFKAS